MRFPDSISSQEFLRTYWQESALFMPAALAPVEPSLDADELAWLATLPDVESRLVYTDRHGETVTYRVEHGPFDESQLAALPKNDWSLLVQDVEKHLPDFRQFFVVVDFVPDWRIDDLMISVAAPGGSVGPHMDNYDVFLCQGSGSRSWSLADANETESDPKSHELSLLKPFLTSNSTVANQGDVLYLPPGVPHWGVAEDLCLTYSIGMRAPNMAELRAGCERLYPEAVGADRKSGETEFRKFYRDPDLKIDEAVAGKISAAAIERLRDQQLLPGVLYEEQIAIVLGSVTTDPKAWLAPECLSKSATTKWLSEMSGLNEIAVHGMARLAYFDSGNDSIVFANGFWLKADAAQCALFRSCCKHRKLQAGDVTESLSDPHMSAFLEWLSMHGVFHPGL